MRSKDTGTGRKILAKVEVPLSVEDITVFALRHLYGVGDDDPKDTIMQSNKRQIFAFAKEALFRFGSEEPKVAIGNKFNGSFKVIESIVKHKFPECD
tara:strand:+ start:864 stop:1154 length:291 start_codon:yes stop_codon:yes gene_type:complete